MSKGESSTNREVALVLIAGLIGFGGAWLGSRATVSTQRDQAQEARQAEARDKRALTYSRFLNVSTRYFDAAEAIEDALPRRCSRNGITCETNAQIEDLLRVRPIFRNALNQVYVYGSSRSVEAARDVLATLSNPLDNAIPTAGVEDHSKYEQTYDAFLNVMCREVSADPRPTC